jgi:hypothetical protein
LSVPKLPRHLPELSDHLSLPSLPEHISRFLYEQTHPDHDFDEYPLDIIPLQDCPVYSGKIYVYSSAVAVYYAPSDLSGIGGMYRERIRSVESWQGGPERRDCIFVEHNPDAPGFRGLHVARVQHFFKIKYQSITYPCALVAWFSAIGENPCSDTGMWMVNPDIDHQGHWEMSVIHIDTILRGAHLIGIAGKHSIPRQLQHTDSLNAFRAFYVNKYIDHHAHEIEW